MRALGQLTLLVVVASSTITCVARAQSAPARGAPSTTRLELVDPWASEVLADMNDDPAAVVDPWAADKPPARTARTENDPEIVDPWSGEPLPRKAPRVLVIELVDPWQDDEPSSPPTAAFPLIVYP